MTLGMGQGDKIGMNSQLTSVSNFDETYITADDNGVTDVTTVT